MGGFCLFVLLPSCTTRRTICFSRTVATSSFTVGGGPGCIGGIITPALRPVDSVNKFHALPSCSFSAVPSSCMTLMLVNNFN